MREQLRSLVAAANAPLVKRVSALELAYQEQRAQLVTYRHTDAAKLARMTAQRDELTGLLASAMGERDAAEARAHDLANQVTTLQCEAGVSSPLPGFWWRDGSPGSTLYTRHNRIDFCVATVAEDDDLGFAWGVLSPENKGVANGADTSLYIAKEQALEAVREHWGPVEVAT